MHPAGAVFITIRTIFRVTRAGKQSADWATSQGYAGTQATGGLRISVYDVIDAVRRAAHNNRQWLAQRCTLRNFLALLVALRCYPS